MELTPGVVLKAKGGWDAIVIWTTTGPNMPVAFYAVHRPGTAFESVPIEHLANGDPITQFSVSEPPSYDRSHPACLEMGKYEVRKKHQ